MKTTRPSITSVLELIQGRNLADAQKIAGKHHYKVSVDFKTKEVIVEDEIFGRRSSKNLETRVRR